MHSSQIARDCHSIKPSGPDALRVHCRLGQCLIPSGCSGPELVPWVPEFEVLYLPPYSPFLNPIEEFFQHGGGRYTTCGPMTVCPSFRPWSRPVIISKQLCAGVDSSHEAILPTVPCQWRHSLWCGWILCLIQPDGEMMNSYSILVAFTVVFLRVKVYVLHAVIFICLQISLISLLVDYCNWFMVRNTVSIEINTWIFSLQHQCCAVLGKFIVGLFVYILPISQTNHEECVGLSLFFFFI